MIKRMGRFLILLVGILAVVSCLPGLGSSDSLDYSGPTEQTVPMGEYIPGTDLRFVGYSDAGAEVLIGDQRTIKKAGDSLDWKGTPVPGVDVTLSQRVLLVNEERLQTVGTVQVFVEDATPEAAQFPDQPTYSYKVAVTYTVRRNAKIPGTEIKYVGKTDSGAELSGVSGYPFRKLGDSIAWTGRLRANTFLDTTLRVLAYTEDFMQVGGLASIGLTE